jgi:hypothetical protein
VTEEIVTIDLNPYTQPLKRRKHAADITPVYAQLASHTQPVAVSQADTPSLLALPRSSIN